MSYWVFVTNGSLPAPLALVITEPASQPGGHWSSLGTSQALVITLGNCRVGRAATIYKNADRAGISTPSTN